MNLAYRSPEIGGLLEQGRLEVNRVMEDAVGRIFPAAVLLVARRGAVIFHQSFGYLDLEEHRTAAQPDTIFDLASLTKLFTATAFMSLVRTGIVRLDQPVMDILPEFAGVRPIGAAENPLTRSIIPVPMKYEGVKVDAGRVTFRHLLTHSSGLAAWRRIFDEGDQAANARAMRGPAYVTPADRMARLNVVYAFDFAFPPGAEIKYSDLGLILLGEAVARLVGTPLDRALSKTVMAPLGMSATRYNPIQQTIDSQSSLPETKKLQFTIAPTEVCPWRGRRLLREVHDENAAALGGVAGHAGLFSTAWDVAALGQLYLNGGEYGGVRLLSPEMVSEMVQEQVSWQGQRRGLAWMLASDVESGCGPSFSHRGYGHTGFTGTSIWVDPQRELVIVLLTNRVYYGRDEAAIRGFRPVIHEAIVTALSSSGN